MEKEKYSYSKINTYLSCHFKFKLKYIDKNFFGGNSLATEYGTLIHAIEETIGNNLKDNKVIDYDDLKKKVISKTKELQDKYPNDYVALDKSGRSYVDKTNYYLSEGIYRLEDYIKEFPSVEVVACEQAFDVEFEGMVFSGYIDRVLRNKDANLYIIQDIKTWNEPKEQKELTTPLQFVIYSLAAKKLYGIKDEQIICQYDLPLCNLKQNAGTKGYMARGIAKLEKLLEKINNKDYSPSPSPLCHWCDFCQTNEDAPKEGKMLCPYYMHWTRENKDFSKENECEGMEHHESILEAYHKKYVANIE